MAPIAADGRAVRRPRRASGEPKYTMGRPVDERHLARLLDDVAAGTPVGPRGGGRRCASLPFEEVPDAKVDHHRELRTGQAEAIYGPGKTPTQIRDIARALAASASGAVLLTRADAEQAAAALEAVPDAIYDERSGSGGAAARPPRAPGAPSPSSPPAPRTSRSPRRRP